MTACETINDRSGPIYSRKRARTCENGKFKHNGQVIGKERCAFYLGICRAVGDYYSVKEMLFQTEGLFKTVMNCPYL